MTCIKRMWINQPSTFGMCHHWHGENVIAEFDRSQITCRVWFIGGETVSAQIPTNTLSNGWLKKKESNQ